MLVPFAEPYDHVIGLGVDGSHQQNLLAPLDCVRLVDAHGVNPQQFLGVGLSNVPES